jgi:hypothetical protein
MRILSLLGILTTLYSCGPSTFTKPERLANGPKNGEWITRRTNGTIKTRINYKNGIKDGISTLYHADGKSIQLAMPYVNGKRHGTSKKYFDNGQLYAETSYQNDELHGARITYYRSGKIKSRLTYYNGQPYADLEEYYLSGVQKEMPAIRHVRVGNQITLSIDSKDCKGVDFFIGRLQDDQIFPGFEALTLLPSDNNTVVIDLNQYTPSYLAVQDIICSCKTSQGNPLIVTKRLTF